MTPPKYNTFPPVANVSMGIVNLTPLLLSVCQWYNPQEQLFEPKQRDERTNQLGFVSSFMTVSNDIKKIVGKHRLIK